VTIYSIGFAPDLLWFVLAVGGVGSVIAGRAARPRIGPTWAHRLLLAGLLLLAALVVYLLLMTWFAPNPAAST
jgi:hypothetical protein